MPKRTRNKSWGGRRAGAGRPPANARPSEPHQTRPPLAPAQPVHVTARITETLTTALARATKRAAGGSRHAAVLHALARAVSRTLARDDFRIVHLGLRVTTRGARLELVVEAADERALARGMQGLQVSAARHLNRAARRTGNVFPDRYRARAIASRDALAAALGRSGMLVLHRAA